jgi:vanillate monooxygenase
MEVQCLGSRLAAGSQATAPKNREGDMFLRNHWYVAASDSEVGRKPFGRMILGQPVVFFRTEAGTPVAFEDRCAHRHLPLSMGKTVGDTLQCHYHGLRFDPTGRCVRIPGQDQIPPSA